MGKKFLGRGSLFYQHFPAAGDCLIKQDKYLQGNMQIVLNLRLPW